MKSIALYNEIKAAVARSLEAEENARLWKEIAKDGMSEARTLTATAKKMKANQGTEIIFKHLLTYILADLSEATPASDADTDLTDYRPGDFPASENNSDEVETTHPVANEEVPHESTNL